MTCAPLYAVVFALWNYGHPALGPRPDVPADLLVADHLLKEALRQYPLKHGPAGSTEHPRRHLGAPISSAAVAVIQENPFHRAGDEGIDHAWVDNAIRPLAYEGHDSKPAIKEVCVHGME